MGGLGRDPGTGWPWSSDLKPGREEKSQEPSFPGLRAEGSWHPAACPKSQPSCFKGPSGPLQLFKHFITNSNTWLMFTEHFLWVGLRVLRDECAQTTQLDGGDTQRTA